MTDEAGIAGISGKSASWNSRNSCLVVGGHECLAQYRVPGLGLSLQGSPDFVTPAHFAGAATAFGLAAEAFFAGLAAFAAFFAGFSGFGSGSASEALRGARLGLAGFRSVDCPGRGAGSGPVSALTGAGLASGATAAVAACGSAGADVGGATV